MEAVCSSEVWEAGSRLDRRLLVLAVMSAANTEPYPREAVPSTLFPLEQLSPA